MTSSTLKNLRSSAINISMALLFCGGVLLGGAEFVGFPWGPVAGGVCWVALGLLALKMRGRDV